MGLRLSLLLAGAAVIWVGVSLRRLAPRSSPAVVPVGDFGKVPDFALLDAAGKTVRLNDLKGAPWVASFLFTRCGGQCPMLTSRLLALSREIPGLRFVSFSVDPGDTPQVLARYAKSYGAGWTFLTGGPGRVQKLSREGFKLTAADGGPREEPILHSSKLVIVDGEGRIRGYFDALDVGQTDALSRLARSLRAAPPRSARSAS